jgi:S-adenosylmethionine hydrolase
VGRVAAGKLAVTYEPLPEGEEFLIEGSSGYLEVSIHRQSTAERSGVAIGDAAELWLKV